jgi:hypothetical protein
MKMNDNTRAMLRGALTRATATHTIGGALRKVQPRPVTLPRVMKRKIDKEGAPPSSR